ncbi:hypothetical protein E1176_01675, partial [Fulvivirga sp. RKSG066]|uniref:hypothetical protein n=1 Tax=Fulvivirga aurantia TaxID=2529383 RepID=UPI001CA39754
MSNIEKISAYLEDEMSLAQRQQFETELTKDPELLNEFNFQKDIIEGIKEARRVELKQMLDNVPVGGAGAGGAIMFGKIASAVAVLGILALGIYYFSLREDSAEPAVTQEEIAEVPLETESTPEVDEVENEAEPIVEVPSNTEVKPTEPESKPALDEVKETETKEKVAAQPEIKKPSAAPIFETSETDSLEAPTNTIVERIDENVSSLDVEIDNTNKKYAFHYKFTKGKLFLFGEFDKGLYEIIEFKT